MRRAHFPLVHRSARAAFSRCSVATAAVLARELAIGLVFRVLAFELLEARKRLGLALGLLGVLLFKGIVPGETAVRVSISGLRGICASIEGPPVGSRTSGIIRAGTNVAGAVVRAGSGVAGAIVRVATIAADVAERTGSGRAGPLVRALADFASVVFGIAQALRRAGGIVGVSARAGSRI